MKKYQYKIVDINGQVHKGLCSEVEVAFLRSRIYREGNLILELKEKKEIHTIDLFNSINSKTLFLFSRQIGSMLKVGLSIIDSFAMAAMQIKKGAMKENILFIVSSLKKGDTLYNSMINCPKRFPRFFLEMIKIGEDSGNLDKLFLKLSEYYYKENRLNKKIINASLYPLIILLSTIIGTIFLMTTFVPAIINMVSSFGSELPEITIFVIGCSNFLQKHILKISIVIAVILIVGIFSNYKGNLEIYSFVKRIPGISNLCNKIIAHKYLTAVSLLVNSGANFVEAMSGSINIIKSNYLKHRINDSINLIREGSEVNTSLRTVEIFDFVSLTIIKLGEDTGKLNDMIGNLIVFEDDNINNQLDKICELIHPVAIIIMSLIVGTLVLAIALPMFSMYGNNY